MPDPALFTGPPYDEAYDGDGEPRPHYAGIHDALAEAAPKPLAGKVRALVEKRAVSFRGRPFPIDVVPRLLPASWGRWRNGAVQRMRVLNALVTDLYGEQTTISSGLLPQRVVHGSPGFTPALRGRLPDTGPPIGIAGLDVVVAGPDSCFVMEDNVRCPAGFAYGEAAAEIAEEAIPGLLSPHPSPSFTSAIREAIRVVSPTDDEPAVAVLVDSLEAPAAFEDRAIATGVGGSLVRRDDLALCKGEVCRRDQRGRLARIDVLLRRDARAQMQDERGVEALLEAPWLSGRIGLLNGLGSAVAGDKLVHAYIPQLTRFLLGEDPILSSIPSLDLAERSTLDRVGEEPAEFVFKPRFQEAGNGVVIYRYASQAEREQTLQGLSGLARHQVAQPLFPLSLHPTLFTGALAKAPVDLRPLVVACSSGFSCWSGALSRFGAGPDRYALNFSRGAGVKPTVVAAP